MRVFSINRNGRKYFLIYTDKQLRKEIKYLREKFGLGRLLYVGNFKDAHMCITDKINKTPEHEFIVQGDQVINPGNIPAYSSFIQSWIKEGNQKHTRPKNNAQFVECDVCHCFFTHANVEKVVKNGITLNVCELCKERIVEVL